MLAWMEQGEELDAAAFAAWMNGLDADEAEWLTLTRGQYESFCSFAGQQSRSFIGYFHPSRRVGAIQKNSKPASCAARDSGFGAKPSFKRHRPRLATWIDLPLQPLRLLSLKRHRCCPPSVLDMIPVAAA